jgi:hypothetical protein
MQRRSGSEERGGERVRRDRARRPVRPARAGPDPRDEFFRLLPLRLDALTWALEERDHVELARAAADLRTAAEALEADVLIDLCRRFEARARDGLLHDGAALEAALTRACDALAARRTVVRAR